MRKSFVIPVVASAALGMLLIATAAAAQRRSETRPVPDTGMIGVGASVSAAFTNAPDLTTGTELAVSAERYFTPRLSLRGQFGGAWANIHGHSFGGTTNPFTALGNVVYNWEGGRIHPHVTAGAGLYRYRFFENNQFQADNALGANLGGGLEYYMTRRDALTGELLYHYVPGRVDGRLATYDPRFWTLAGGYKKYF